MKWFIRRLLTLWLIFCLLCGAAIVIGRVDHTPTLLQALGFDTCDGDPCFRGLKPGIDWTKAQPPLSQGTWHGKNFYELPTNLDASLDIALIPDTTLVSAIELSERISPIGDFGVLLPFTVGDVVTQYGPPCRVYISGSTTTDWITLIYPTLDVDVPVADDHHVAIRHDFHLLTNSPIESFVLRSHDAKYGKYITCNDSLEGDGLIGPWRGFISPEMFYNYNRHDFSLSQPMPNYP